MQKHFPVQNERPNHWLGWIPADAGMTKFRFMVVSPVSLEESRHVIIAADSPHHR